MYIMYLMFQASRIELLGEDCPSYTIAASTSALLKEWLHCKSLFVIKKNYRKLFKL